jgi:6-pyruvoyltetrahydropterin/6-carboxytetrahydropterin synthase
VSPQIASPKPRRTLLTGAWRAHIFPKGTKGRGGTGANVFEVTVEGGFAAAHRLREYEGACERLHGHNYKVAVSVRAGEVGPSGMVADFKVLKGALREVLGRLDHRCLNDDVPDFGEGGANPTAESIARWVAERMAEALAPGPRPSRVTVWESDTSAATYLADEG